MVSKQSIRTSKNLSLFERNLLGFWNEFFPLGIAKVPAKRSESKVKMPKNASGKELLHFYSSLLPKRINQVVQEVSKLKFPILDPSELNKQLRKKGKLNNAQEDILMSIPLTSYPIGGSRPVLKRSLVYSFMASFKECSDARSDCYEKARDAEGNIPWRAKDKCDNEYSICAEEVSWANSYLILALIFEAIESKRRLFPEPFPPEPFPPWTPGGGGLPWKNR